jgi:hypothetical protein
MQDAQMLGFLIEKKCESGDCEFNFYWELFYELGLSVFV